jgi:late competence protein required for DNA uptake (superfamily II DNA/RNA helicase)
MNYKNVKRNKLTHKLWNYLKKRPRQHDPMLVLNMSIFNFEGGWSRIFNPIKARENN